MAAGDVYQDYGVPAITPASTNVGVTAENPWYFRSLFNDRLQGRFLARYAREVFGQSAFSIIYEEDPYGSYLAQVFRETVAESGGEIRHQWSFPKYDPDRPGDKSRLTDIVLDLKARGDAGVVFLSTHAEPGIELLKVMKDSLVLNPVIGPDAFASETFRQGFADLPKEKLNPGFYTNGMYVTTPLIFDTTNEMGQRFQADYRRRFNEDPGWHAAFAYDTAKVLVHALRNIELDPDQVAIGEDRTKLRNFLAGMRSADQAVEGVTGYNFFDNRGDAQKPVLIGVYKNRNIVSALTQFQTVTNPAERYRLEAARQRERGVMKFDQQYMYRINVVYTGIEINEIRDLNFKNLTCDLDFFLWFRYQGNIDVSRMIFLNAVEPVELEAPERVAGDPITYQLFRVRGRFRMDFMPGRIDYGEHMVGVSFRHPEIDRNNLIYVKDVLGMGRHHTEAAMVKKMREQQVLSPATDWKIETIRFYQDTVEENSLGDPDYLEVSGGTIDYSRFNVGVQIAPDRFILRGLIPRTWVNSLLAVSAAMVLLLPLLIRTRTFNPYRRVIWVLQLGFAFLLLLSAEYFLINQLGDTYYLEPILLAIQMFWWMIPAFLLNIGVHRFIWDPLEERTGRTIPQIIRNAVAIVIYVIAFFGIVAFVFDQRLTSLLATSGVIAMILGLAIQINISNIFSGIAINVERPFRVGDWIKVGDFTEGKVEDINWRTTRLRTRDDTVLCIPNSQASESAIENFSYPDDGYFKYFTILIDPVHPPERVKKILLDAALSTPTVEKEPPPRARFLGLTAGMTGQSQSWAANYLISTYARDYGQKFAHNEAVWDNVYTHLRRAGIRTVYNRQEMHMYVEGFRRRRQALPDKSPVGLLREIEIFAPFSEEAKQYLAGRMKQRHAYPGEWIVQQGDSGSSLFIIEEGVVSIRVSFDQRSRPVEVARLGAGKFFGEMALLTGEKRTATVVAVAEARLYEVTKEDIAPLIEQEPAISRRLSELLSQRKMATEAKKPGETDDFDKENFASQIFTRIQNFFGFGRA
jgi:branched-chain amino acid transport system substrate-binding protein